MNPVPDTKRMTSTTGRNTCNLFACLALLSVAGISCAQFERLTRKSFLTEKTKELYYNVPAGFDFAGSETEYNRNSSLLIILPNSSEIILNEADSLPIDLTELGKELEEFDSRTSPDKRTVYIAASVAITSNAFLAVINEIRRHDINLVQLLASDRKIKKTPEPIKEAKDIGFPAKSFRVHVFADDFTGKPEPLALVVRVVDGKPQLNNESYTDFDGLMTKLNEIFRSRETNGVFRERTNEVEKTVRVHIDESNPDQKYSDIVGMINAAQGAGASPIILIDSGTAWRKAESPIGLPTYDDAPPPPPKAPFGAKTLSGGVINGKAILLPKPAYPPAARAVRASGTVTVAVLIDTNGKVVSAEAVSGHPLLRAAAVQAARSARFEPTLLGGEPVNVKGVITYNFLP